MKSAKNQFVVFDIFSCPSTQHHLHKTAKRKKNITSKQHGREQHVWRCSVQLQQGATSQAAHKQSAGSQRGSDKLGVLCSLARPENH